MPLNFPTSPSNNQTYTFNNKTWIFDGYGWALDANTAINNIPIGNITPSTGNFTTINASGNITGSYFIGNGSQLTGIAGTTTTCSASPPASPNSGDFWIDSNTGTMYIYFNDGTSNQWAEMESLYAFSSVEPNTTISNGNSNVIVAANSNVTVSVSGNSNVTTFTGSNIFVTANIIPTANITYDLGTTSNRFKDLWLSNSTIYIGAASITTDGGNLVLTNPDGGQSVVSGNQTVSSNTLVENNSNLAVANTYIGLSVNSNANVLLVTASGANITGTANISGNANVGNIGATQVVASGNVSGLYFIGNGSQLTGIDATAINNGNSNVKVTANSNVTVSVAGTSNILVITDTGINTSGTMNASGNISASYFIGNGSQLTGIDATAIQNGTANVRTYNNGNVAISANGSANVLVISGTGANIVGTANVSGNANVGNLGATGIVATTISGSLTTASQPNITGLGTLSGLNATGNVVAGNVYANSGTVGASLIAGTLTTTSQPNVTSVGTLGNLSITNNLTVGGNFTVTGNLVYANVSDLVVNDPLIYLASNNVGDTEDIGLVANWDDGVYQHGGMARDHTDGVWKFYSNVVAEPTTTIDWANAVYDPVKMGSLSVVANITSGNANLGNSVTANYFTGNFYGTANSATTATTAGTVTTAAQPNITSTGTLTSLGVSGNITAANITANTGIFSGNGSSLTALNASNVSSGTLAQARLANASVTLGSTALTLGSTVTTVAGLTSVTATTFTGSLSGAATSATTAGTVTTAAQPNITSTGTLTSLTISGNLTVDTNTLFVDSANNSVGIATTTPNYTLHVVGNVYATGDVVSASDMTIKSDVVKIDNALEKLLQLSGYTFLRQGEDMRSAGVSAQDVQKVLPEAVRGSDGALSVAYGALSGLIIESIKDLKSELERIKGLLNVN